MRKSGIDLIGDVPWGTHFGLFYETRQDLIDFLVPYFEAGLKNNEYCMWVTAEPLNASEARASMAEAMPDFDVYMDKGQIEIIPYTEWYKINGVFVSERVLNGWLEKLRKAKERGFIGLRLTGNESWLEPGIWKDFIDYERKINAVIGQYDMIAACSYSLEKCETNDILDVVSTHQFALTRRNGDWKIIEDQGQKRARTALQESEERFKAIYDRAAMGIGISDHEGRILDCNTAFLEMLGYTKEELWQKYFTDITHPDDVSKNVDLFKQAISGQIDKYQMEKRYLRKDGSPTWCVLTVSVITDAKGDFKYSLAMIDDITEHKRADEEREISVEFLRLVNDSRRIKDLIRAATTFFQEKSGCAAVGIRLRDGDDYPYYETRGFSKEFVLAESHLCLCDDTGLPVRERGGNPVLECMCGNVIRGRFDPSKPFFTDRGSFWTNNTTRLLATTTEADRQARTRNRCNGEGYESVAVIPIRHGGECLGLLQLNDPRKGYITRDQVAMWERLAEYLAVALAKFQAEEALKEAKAQAELYLDLMGHDISNMHQIAMAQLELAREFMDEEGGLKIEDRELIETTLETLMRSARLIENVRNLQKLKAREFKEEAIDLNGLLSSVVKEYEPMVPANSIKFVGNGPRHVMANRLLHDVFSNLVGNAVKHSNGNGIDIHIKLENSCYTGINYYKVSVEDNGPGIPDDLKDKIFNRLQRGQTKARGLGLGLYLVKSLVDSYHGKVWVEDRVSGDYTKGARFVVYLPVAEDTHVG